MLLRERPNLFETPPSGRATSQAATNYLFDAEPTVNERDIFVTIAATTATKAF